jgi:hypothetical protein
MTEQRIGYYGLPPTTSEWRIIADALASAPAPYRDAVLALLNESAPQAAPIYRRVIEGRLPGLNAIIRAGRGNKYAANRDKQNLEEVLQWYMRSGPVDGGYWVFLWTCKNRQRNPDNIAASVKFIFDAAQKSGFIENDGWQQVRGLLHAFTVAEDESVTVECYATAAAAASAWLRYQEVE